MQPRDGFQREERPRAGEWAPAEVAAARRRLVRLLCEAAELEHGLCLQYLYAAFSLKSHPRDPGLDELQVERTRQWKGVLLLIAREEMLHLALVCNLLGAVGAAPHLRRPNFPQSARFYPLGVDSSLEPFSETTLNRFLVFEKPGDDRERSRKAPFDGSGGDVGDWISVGQLYDLIKEVVRAVPEHQLFVSSHQRQIDAAAVLDPDRLFPNEVLVGYGVEPFPVADQASAMHAIDLIVEQGEGGAEPTGRSHYERLLQIQREFDEEQAKAKRNSIPFEPARPVVANPVVWRQPDAPHAQILTDPTARLAAELFNGGYGLMMLMLERFFRTAGESFGESKALQQVVFFPLMTMVVRPIGEMLTELPAFRGAPAPTAGATFEFPRELQALPERRAAWVVFRERLREIATGSDQLRRTLANTAAPHLAERASFVADNLARLADNAEKVDLERW